RTKEESNTMIHMAHASRYHWGVVGGPEQLAIGEWQISRVYAALGRPEPSLYHAERCLEICEAHKVGYFPFAYAYEALARTFAIAGKSRERAACLKLARLAGAKIHEKDDAELFVKDLRTVPPARRRRGNVALRYKARFLDAPEAGRPLPVGHRRAAVGSALQARCDAHRRLEFDAFPVRTH